MNNIAQNFQHDFDKPETILAQCTAFNPLDATHLNHPIIKRFGSPKQPIYVDQSNVDINGVTYEQPLILPIYNGQLELVQCAVMQDGQRVSVIPDGLAKGFARYGNFYQDKPIIITHNLEAFFKIAQTGYAVILVLLPTLCNANFIQLKPFDFEQIQFVIHQLSQAGYKQLYLPVRPEHIQLEAFQSLEKNTAVRLLNQYQKIGESEFLIELSQHESKEEITAFLDEAIEQVSSKSQWGELLPLAQAETTINSP